MKFKVGDRVSYTGDTFKDTGTVVKIEAGKTRYIVRMDHNPGWRIYSDEHLHTEDGLEVGDGYWYCNNAELEPYADPAEKKEKSPTTENGLKDGLNVGDRVEILKGKEITDFDRVVAGMKATVVRGYDNNLCVVDIDEVDVKGTLMFYTQLKRVFEDKPDDTRESHDEPEVDDRVVVRGSLSYPELNGATGKVVALKEGLVGIEFDEKNPKIEFHGCDGAGKQGYCFWIVDDNVFVIDKVKKDGYKFKVGDRVIFARPVRENEECWAGKIGTIAVVHDNGLGGVLEFDDGGKVCFIWIELEPAPESKPEEPKKSADPEKKVEKEIPRTIVIRVSSKGATAKYLFGKKVQAEAEIRKHPDDQPNDALAARLVIEKMFGKHNCGSIDEMNVKAECASKAAEAVRNIDWNALMFKALAEDEEE